MKFLSNKEIEKQIGKMSEENLYRLKSFVELMENLGVDFQVKKNRDAVYFVQTLMDEISALKIELLRSQNQELKK